VAKNISFTADRLGFSSRLQRYRSFVSVPERIWNLKELGEFRFRGVRLG